MTDAFDDLYDQILQCERRVHERKHVLQEVKGHIQLGKDSLKEALEECGRLQEELQEKINERTEADICSKSLEAREAILAAQKTNLVEECDTTEINMTAVRDELEREMSEFCAKVELHNTELDLSASGRHACLRKNEELLKQLRQQELSLLKGIEDYERHKRTIAELENEKRFFHQTLRDMTQNKKDIEECLKREKEKVDRQEEERQHIAKTPARGEEYKRLQAELAALATEPLEQQCGQLQQTLRELNQQLHNKQHQQLRQQQMRLQQHQRQHQRGQDYNGAQQKCCPVVAVVSSLGGHHEYLEEGSLANLHCVTNMPPTNASKFNQQGRSALVADEADFTSDDDDYTLPDLIPRETVARETKVGSDGEVRVQGQGQRHRPVFKSNRTA